METYFDGLMKIDPVDSNGPEKTRSIFIKTKKGFQGKIWVHDAFFTKKPMTLYVKVKETYCAKTNKQVIRFELSSKEFDHPTWEIFKEIKLLAPCK
ncbi:MAG: hypothetical protein IPL65_05500 [Lewinellaceae bacterium]|nr:hypothetical protein [Lewinellaceae bacterium]